MIIDNKISNLIKEKYHLAPFAPGVYMMKDNKGRIIYVGKAKNLKKRLASYFVKEAGHDPKTSMLVKSIADFDLIITQTEHEALILEATLIKKQKPKYNIFLKDGKNYPCFRINTIHKYPLLEVVRKIKNDGATYFGPYSSGESVRKTLKQVNKIFKLRKCKENQFKHRSRPCIQFQINACLGPCCNDVPVKIYQKIVNDVILFLKNRAPELIKRLKQEMVAEAEQEQFEKASTIRDTIFAIEKTLEKQIAVTTDMIDRDVVASAAEQGFGVITLIFIRSGYVVGTEHHIFDLNFNSTAQIMEEFLKQYYQTSTNQTNTNQTDTNQTDTNQTDTNQTDTKFIPQQILVSEDFEDRVLLEENLSMTKGIKVNILVPERGEKKRIVEMALQNAERELETHILKNTEIQKTLIMLQKFLAMENYPKRIECFDNSNISGTDPVSSMVVFIDGEPNKALYRKFIIKNVTINDDYSYMHEVLTRRFKKKLISYAKQSEENTSEENTSEENTSEDKKSKKHSSEENELPHLIVVDGGKGQLAIAMAVLKKYGLSDQIRVVALAKKDSNRGETHDKIYIADRTNPLNITQSSQSLKVLYLLQRLRDEAHRFAITFHKKRRSIRIKK